MSTIRIGIMPPAKIREMTMSIAKGEFKPKRNWSTIWFPSMKAVSEVRIRQGQDPSGTDLFSAVNGYPGGIPTR